MMRSLNKSLGISAEVLLKEPGADFPVKKDKIRFYLVKMDNGNIRLYGRDKYALNQILFEATPKGKLFAPSSGLDGLWAEGVTVREAEDDEYLDLEIDV
jgi:hypothetical protein